MIDNIQIKAKKEDEKRRMAEAAIAIDFYNGKQVDALTAVIMNLYPETGQDICKYITPTNIVRAITDQCSILFQTPPEINIDATPAAQELLADVINKAEMWKKLIAADRMTTLTGKVGLTVHWHKREKRVVVDIITPDRCIVELDPEDPTKAIKVQYCIGSEKNLHQATPVNVYATWTLDGYYECHLNQDFEEIKRIPNSETANIYGNIIPIVWFANYIEMDSFWVDHGYPLIEAGINIALRKLNLDVALDYQSYSTMVTKGLPQDKTFKAGITRRLDLPGSDAFGGNAQSDAYFITPDAKLKEVADIINAKEVSAAKDHHLSSEAFNQESGNITSGYQLRLTERRLEEHNNLKKEIFRPEIVQLVKLIAMCYNAQSQSSNIPIDAPITVTFGSRAFVANPIETTTLQMTKIQAGLMSLPDAIRENNPDLTQEEAIAEAQRIKQEQADLSGNMISPLSDEDLS